MECEITIINPNYKNLLSILYIQIAAGEIQTACRHRTPPRFLFLSVLHIYWSA